MQGLKLGGIAMITGAMMGVVTMVFHPTGHDVMRDVTGQGAMALAVHALALVAAPIVFYGGFVLTRRLAPRGQFAELALVFYGVSAVATMMAATASGFLAPGLIAQTMTQEGDAGHIAGAVLHYNFGLNQAFAKILVAASSVAIGLWSLEILRTRLMRPASGVVGSIVALAALALLFSGHLRLDVHGFGAVVLAQAIWSVMVGVELIALGSVRIDES